MLLVFTGIVDFVSEYAGARSRSATGIAVVSLSNFFQHLRVLDE